MALKRTYSQKFEQFWNSYPKRNGRRCGNKPKTYRLWQELDATEKQLLLEAVDNYADECDPEWVRYPERFLQPGYWEGWVGKRETPTRKQVKRDEAREVELMRYELVLAFGNPAIADWIDDDDRVRIEYDKMIQSRTKQVRQNKQQARESVSYQLIGRRVADRSGTLLGGVEFNDS